MATVAELLKSEIARVSRKAVRTEVASLKKAVAGYRHHIASLKKRVGELEVKARKLEKSGGRRSAGEASPEANGRKQRFRAVGVLAHRKKLGLSAERYGALLGVSGLTIYKWEKGEVQPQSAKREAWLQMRNMSKQDAQALLVAMGK